MKLLLSVIFVIANIPSLAQAEAPVTPRLKRVTKATLKPRTATLTRPSTLVAPLAKVTGPTTVRTATALPSSVDFGAPGVSPIHYGYTGMPQGGIIMPSVPPTATGAPASNDPNFASMAPAIMSAMGGMKGLGGDSGSGSSNRRNSAVSPAESDESETASTPSTPTVSPSGAAAPTAAAAGGGAAPTGNPPPDGSGATQNAMATNSGMITGAGQPTGDVPPGPGDTANANVFPPVGGATGPATANTSTNSPNGIPPSPSEAEIASANSDVSLTNSQPPPNAPSGSTASAFPDQSQTAQATPAAQPKAATSPRQPAASPPKPQFPQCSDNKYTDNPKVISQMMEYLGSRKVGATHVLGTDDGKCQATFMKAPETRLALTNCKVSGSIAARVCMSGNTLVALTNSSKATGFLMGEAPIGMKITMSYIGNGQWIMNNSVQPKEVHLTEMAAAENGTSSR